MRCLSGVHISFTVVLSDRLGIEAGPRLEGNSKCASANPANVQVINCKG